MTRLLKSLAIVLAMLCATVVPSIAADANTVVRVALLDMSSSMPMGMPAYGMMGPGMMNSGMMGMMNPSMMGSGMMGSGMMGGMMSIRIDQSAVKAGKITFDVTNWSRSALHEMLIVAVDNSAAALPYDYSQARVPEDQVKVLGEVSDLQPNGSKSFEVELAAGSYVLICNLPGHYAAGMAVPFIVAQ